MANENKSKNIKSSKDVLNSAKASLDTKDLTKINENETKIIGLITEQNKTTKGLKDAINEKDALEKDNNDAIRSSLRKNNGSLSTISNTVKEINSKLNEYKTSIEKIGAEKETQIQLLGSIKVSLIQITSVLSAFRADYLMANNGKKLDGTGYYSTALLLRDLSSLGTSESLQKSIKSMRTAANFANIMSNAVRGKLGNNKMDNGGEGILNGLLNKLIPDDDIKESILPLLNQSIGMFNIDDSNINSLAGSILKIKNPNAKKKYLDPLNQALNDAMNDNNSPFKQFLAGTINKYTGLGTVEDSKQKEQDPNLVMSALAPFADDIKDLVKTEFEALTNRPKKIPIYAQPVWVVNSKYQVNALEKETQTLGDDIFENRFRDLVLGRTNNKKDEYGNELLFKDVDTLDYRGSMVDKYKKQTNMQGTYEEQIQQINNKASQIIQDDKNSKIEKNKESISYKIGDKRYKDDTGDLYSKYTDILNAANLNGNFDDIAKFGPLFGGISTLIKSIEKIKDKDENGKSRLWNEITDTTDTIRSSVSDIHSTASNFESKNKKESIVSYYITKTILDYFGIDKKEDKEQYKTITDYINKFIIPVFLQGAKGIDFTNEETINRSLNENSNFYIEQIDSVFPGDSSSIYQKLKEIIQNSNDLTMKDVKQDKKASRHHAMGRKPISKVSRMYASGRPKRIEQDGEVVTLRDDDSVETNNDVNRQTTIENLNNSIWALTFEIAAVADIGAQEIYYITKGTNDDGITDNKKVQYSSAIKTVKNVFKQYGGNDKDVNKLASNLEKDSDLSKVVDVKSSKEDDKEKNPEEVKKKSFFGKLLDSAKKSILGQIVKTKLGSMALGVINKVKEFKKNPKEFLKKTKIGKAVTEKINNIKTSVKAKVSNIGTNIKNKIDNSDIGQKFKKYKLEKEANRKKREQKRNFLNSKREEARQQQLNASNEANIAKRSKTTTEINTEEKAKAKERAMIETTNAEKQAAEAEVAADANRAKDVGTETEVAAIKTESATAEATAKEASAGEIAATEEASAATQAATEAESAAADAAAKGAATTGGLSAKVTGWISEASAKLAPLKPLGIVAAAAGVVAVTAMLGKLIKKIKNGDNSEESDNQSSASASGGSGSEKKDWRDKSYNDFKREAKEKWDKFKKTTGKKIVNGAKKGLRNTLNRLTFGLTAVKVYIAENGDVLRAKDDSPVMKQNEYFEDTNVPLNVKSPEGKKELTKRVLSGEFVIVPKSAASAGKFVRNALKLGGELLKKGVKGAWEGIKKGAKGVWKGIKSAGKAIGGGAKKVWGGIKKTGEFIGDTAKKAWNGIKSINEKITNVRHGLEDKIKDNAKKLFNGVKSVTGKVVGGIKKVTGAIHKEAEKALDFVSDVAKGILSDIEQAKMMRMLTITNNAILFSSNRVRKLVSKMMQSPLGKLAMTKPEVVSDVIFKSSNISNLVDSDGNTKSNSFFNSTSTMKTPSEWSSDKEMRWIIEALGIDNGMNRKLTTNLNDKSLSENASLAKLQVEKNITILDKLNTLSLLIGGTGVALSTDGVSRWTTSQIASLANENYGAGKHRNYGRANKNTLKDELHIYQRDYSDYDFTTGSDTEKHTLGDSGCGPASAALVESIYNGKKKYKNGKSKYGRSNNDVYASDILRAAMDQTASYYDDDINAVSVASYNNGYTHDVRNYGWYRPMPAAFEAHIYDRDIYDGQVEVYPLTEIKNPYTGNYKGNSGSGSGGSGGRGGGGSSGSGGGSSSGGSGGSSQTISDDSLNTNTINKTYENTKNIIIKARGNNNIVICNNFDEKIKTNIEDIISNFKHLNDTQGKALEVLKNISDLIGDDNYFPGMSLNDSGLELLLKGI